MLSIHVVLAWDRRATVQIDPACCVHELLERAQDALQQGISSLTTTSGQLLAGARIESNTARWHVALRPKLPIICIHVDAWLISDIYIYINIIICGSFPNLTHTIWIQQSNMAQAIESRAWHQWSYWEVCWIMLDHVGSRWVLYVPMMSQWCPNDVYAWLRAY